MCFIFFGSPNAFRVGIAKLMPACVWALARDLIYAQRGGNNELFMPIYGCQAGLHVNWQKLTTW